MLINISDVLCICHFKVNTSELNLELLLLFMQVIDLKVVPNTYLIFTFSNLMSFLFKIISVSDITISCVHKDCVQNN